MENIRPVTVLDAATISSIYAHYVKHTPITFEIDVPDETEIKKRITDYTKKYPWIVATVNGKVVAYAYAADFKARAAYRWSVESSIYVDKDFHGKGLGQKLYTELCERLKEMGVLNIIGGITLPNPASEKLHEKMGFQFVARFPEVGFKMGQWYDVGYWQLTLPKPDAPEEVKPV